MNTFFFFNLAAGTGEKKTVPIRKKKKDELFRRNTKADFQRLQNLMALVL